MINLEEITNYFDCVEQVVSRVDFWALHLAWQGYNLYDDGDSSQFDVELRDCIFTIKKYRDREECLLSNEFQVYCNGEWIDFERC